MFKYYDLYVILAESDFKMQKYISGVLHTRFKKPYRDKDEAKADAIFIKKEYKSQGKKLTYKVKKSGFEYFIWYAVW